MKRIGIYGGTFDPIHLGHMAAARAVSRELELDRLLLIPAGIPPHKDQAVSGACGDHRLAMTAIAADRLQLPIPVKALSLELERQGKSYTVDALRTLRDTNPDAELCLLMGSDMFLTLHQWHLPEEICLMAHICAFHRKGGEEETFLRQKTRLEQTYGAKVTIVPVADRVEISSTEIREQLSRGDAPQMLEESVYGYILRHGLYGTKADLTRLEWPALRACANSMIRAKRIPHVRGVEETAVYLARRWGADETRARQGGILHDVTKYWSEEEHLALCWAWGISLDEQELQSEKLLHSKTGAAIARREFGVSEEVERAICWHTTGKADKTLLEKILYVAG